MSRRKSKPTYAEFNLFDSDGTQQYHSWYRTPQKSKLGGGWVAFYKASIKQLINDVPNLSTLKVYLFLASKQTFQKCVMVTPTTIQKELSMSSSTVAVALKWLKDNNFIQMYHIDGNTGWLLNPKSTVCGTATKREKEAIWNAGMERKKAELEEDLKKREALLESLDALIASKLSEGDDDDYDETYEELTDSDSDSTFEGVTTEIQLDDKWDKFEAHS